MIQTYKVLLYSIRNNANLPLAVMITLAWQEQVVSQTLISLICIPSMRYYKINSNTLLCKLPKCKAEILDSNL